jgi:4-amino-4-deoxy-L-arabinose transferase-like glycosyltransferase
MLFNKTTLIFVILLVALLLRLLFLHYGVPLYFHDSNFNHLLGDSTLWLNSLENLIKHGTYCTDFQHKIGYFEKPPGYTFFLFPFYKLSGNHIHLTILITVYAQLVIDVASVYLLYAICNKLFNSTLISNIAAIIYTFYPFSIIWTPVIYAETLSIFVMLLAIYFLVSDKKYKLHKMIIVGLLLGYASLCRLQVGFLVPCVIIYFFIIKQSYSHFIKNSLFLTIGFCAIYIWWPLRNIVFHHQAIISMKSDSPCYQEDMYGFWNYITTIQEGFEPEFKQIIENKKIDLPPIAFKNVSDSNLVIETFKMCQTCGSSFSNFSNSVKKPIQLDSACNHQIKINFDLLTTNQKKHNPFHAYVTVPLLNLKKAIFKSSKMGSESSIMYKLLFSYRSFLILFGFISFFLFKHKTNTGTYNILKIIMLYFSIWYLYVCFIYRNLEMRYFLHADILLIIIFSFGFINMINFLRKKESLNLV